VTAYLNTESTRGEPTYHWVEFDQADPLGHLAVYRDLTGDHGARLPRNSMETLYLGGSHTKRTVRRLVDRINAEYQRRKADQ